MRRQPGLGRMNLQITGLRTADFIEDESQTGSTGVHAAIGQ